MPRLAHHQALCAQRSTNKGQSFQFLELRALQTSPRWICWSASLGSQPPKLFRHACRYRLSAYGENRTVVLKEGVFRSGMPHERLQLGAILKHGVVHRRKGMTQNIMRPVFAQPSRITQPFQPLPVAFGLKRSVCGHVCAPLAQHPERNGFQQNHPRAGRLRGASGNPHVSTFKVQAVAV